VKNGRTAVRALWVIGSILCITLTKTPTTLAAASSTSNARVETGVNIVVEKPQAPKSELSKTDAPKPARSIRRIKGSEMTVPVVKKAREIINANYKKPFGTEIDFEIDGKKYVGRIEQHYHPPGGELRPWGLHPGCSLYVVENG
jgi:hypothetical protein